MKIEGHIVSVDSAGDKLLITVLGCGVAEGAFARSEKQHLAIPTDQRSQRAFYVGRKVTIDVRPA